MQALLKYIIYLFLLSGCFSLVYMKDKAPRVCFVVKKAIFFVRIYLNKSVYFEMKFS